VKTKILLVVHYPFQGRLLCNAKMDETKRYSTCDSTSTLG
jgi:hypothetical protein